ncbi:TonB-dependent receptor [Granulicella tundricola]|uniref:TonB-dependent receptor n=1 Tax=Granulicella tundricola (strain ATCC BAA-1859 / DSM 23138 / MP5ACTX9) TaxID=1198114 RepID=E8X3N2_GRATM|nr:TonB-dependent receptor [Granulicella tundricola]ADW68223.1 TonB-dependent receptor [Granulicella tundricola MP5ACTX9]
MRSSTRFKRLVPIAFLALRAPLAAVAQTAEIRGSVLDPSGAALAGAHITLTGHGPEKTVSSDASGSYDFPSLPAGTYTLTIESPNFSRYENSSLHVSATGILDWPVHLTLQSASFSVAVQSDTDALQQIPTVGKTGTMLEDMPQSISVITSRLSESQGDLVLADTVRNAPGVIQGGTDGFGFADRFQIRGLEARIYNDGFSDGDERNGIPHSLNGVERVEILEGPGSSLFGSGPPGGTINLVHYTPSPRFGTGLQFQTGSFGLYSGSAYLTGSTPIHGLDYRIDTLLQHKDGYRALPGGDYELRPTLGYTTSRNVLLLAADGRELQAVPDPAGLIYLNHTPISVVPRDTKYSTPFSFGNQAIGRFTASDVWQAAPFLTVNNRFSYMYRNLSILRNGDGGGVVGTALTGRQLRNQHDVVNDFDYEAEPIFTFHTGRIRHTLLTGVEIQHQSIADNRATASLQNIANIFAPVIPETSRASLVFLRDATHSGFLDDLRATYEGLYATDQIDLTSRWKLRVGGREDFWQTTLAPQIFVPGRSLGNGVLIEPPSTFSRNDTPFSWNVGTVYRVLPGVNAFFGVAHSNLVNFNSEATQNGVQAPETGTQYEAGIKAAALNDRILITAAAFHVKRDNVFSLVSDIPVFNDQLTQGGEGSVELSLTHHWKLNANGTGMHAALTNNPSSPAATGRRPQGVPNRIVNLWTTYDIPFSHQQTLSFSGGFTNRSSMFADLLNTNSIPSYTTADLVANFKTHKLTGAFGVRNLADTRYFTAANGAGGFVGDARSYFGKLNWQFGNRN